MKRQSLLPVFIIALTAFSVAAKRQKTTIPGRLQEIPVEDNSSIPAPGDTLRASDVDLSLSVTLAGYDKPLTASKETLHVVNLSTTDTITGLSFTIDYLDRRGRQLHSRRVDLRCDIPPAETRIVSFPTWDTQRSFYYALGPKPRRLSTPYTIRTHLVCLIIHKAKK